MASKKAGHRSWARAGQKVPGSHRGDIMSKEVRSKVMSHIKGKNTKPERLVAAELRRRRVYFSTHANDISGRPDIVFRKIKLVVFVDGTFWHGWRFPLWRHKLSKKWQEKIANTRARDQRNFRKLRRSGWRVLRIWEHRIERSVIDVVDQIESVRNELKQQTSN